ncbi:MAG: hypothetical protein AAF611_20145 [Bacteroidota bacterium]
MKKQKIKSLKLSKQKVANFKPILGGRPPKSFFQRECKEPDPISDISCFIESNCVGCTVSTKNSYYDC